MPFHLNVRIIVNSTHHWHQAHWVQRSGKERAAAWLSGTAPPAGMGPPAGMERPEGMARPADRARRRADRRPLRAGPSSPVAGMGTLE